MGYRFVYVILVGVQTFFSCFRGGLTTSIIFGWGQSFPFKFRRALEEIVKISQKKGIQDLVFSVKLHLGLISLPLNLVPWHWTLIPYVLSLDPYPLSLTLFPYPLVLFLSRNFGEGFSGHCYCQTLAPSWILSQAENVASFSLQYSFIKTVIQCFFCTQYRVFHLILETVSTIP